MRRSLVLLMLMACSPGMTVDDAGVGGGTAGGASAGGPGGGAAGGVAGGVAGGSAGGTAGGTAGGSAGGGSAGGGTATAGHDVVYVGSTNTIYFYDLERGDGGLTPRGNIVAGMGASFLAVHPSKRWLYAVNEGNSMVSAFAIDAGTGGLTFLNRVGSAGSGPAHLSVHPGGQYVLISNYGSGHIGVLPILDGGLLGVSIDTKDAGVNAHQIISDPSGTRVYVPCLNSQLVAQYDFDGGLTRVDSLGTDAGAGPRHLDLHPSGQWAYLINESSRTMSALDVSPTTGRLSHKQTLPTTPPGMTTASTAEVFVHPAGHSVYGSNRGHNSIVHFQLDAGFMTYVGTTPTGGNTPRNFCLSSDGRLLLVANEGSGNVVAMRIDPVTGALTSLGVVALVPGMPKYVGIVTLP